MPKSKSDKSNVILFPTDRTRKGSGSLGPVPTFPMFIEQVERLDFSAAGRTLAGLLNIDEQTGTESAIYFSNRYHKDNQFFEKAKVLRKSVEEESHNESIALMAEIFNIQGPLAVVAVTHLKKYLDSVANK